MNPLVKFGYYYFYSSMRTFHMLCSLICHFFRVDDCTVA